MSSGTAVISGSHIEYILRMPEYEMKAGVDPAAALLPLLQFRSGGETARRTGGECHIDTAHQQYLCAADYQFATVPDEIDVECRFYEATVTNHVHMLTAERAGKYDRAILDATFSTATLRFRPLSPAEIALQQAVGGALRTWTSAIQMLLLIALAFAARSRVQLVLFAGTYVVGQTLGTLLLSRVSAWQPPPRFAEIAAAIALAYLGVELVAWPKAGGRWALAAVFGLFGGMYFSVFVRDSGFSPEAVLAGCDFAGAATVIAVGAAALFLPASVQRFMAWMMIVAGALWLIVRMRT